MKTHRNVIILSALALGVLGSVRAADVTGKWKAEFDTPVGHVKYTYDLKAAGDKLTGKAIREQDGQKTETEIKDGKVTANAVSFAEALKIQDQDMRIDYNGKVAGDEIKFTRKVGDFATTEIVAKREKEAASSVAGKWQAEFDTQIGKQTYTYEFKLDGDKLTGKAVGGIAGQTSDTEIAQGKVSGADISFVENLKFGDMDIRVDYAGQIAGDEIKFTRKIGDFATEELVAKRAK